MRRMAHSCDKKFGGTLDAHHASTIASKMAFLIFSKKGPMSAPSFAALDGGWREDFMGVLFQKVEDGWMAFAGMMKEIRGKKASAIVLMATLSPPSLCHLRHAPGVGLQWYRI